MDLMRYPLASRLNDEDLSSYERKNLITDFTSLIKVLVGKEKVPFLVHTDILISAAEYFKAACKREWLTEKDGDFGIIHLENDNPDHFRIFVHFAYTGKLEFDNLWGFDSKSERVSIPADSSKLRRPRYPGPVLFHPHPPQDFLIELFIFGDSKLAGPFKNAIIDELVLCISFQESYCRDRLEQIWQETAPGSQLRKLFFDSAIFYDKPADLIIGLRNRSKMLSTVLFYAQAEFLINEKRIISPRGKGRCAYHVHKVVPGVALTCKAWDRRLEVPRHLTPTNSNSAKPNFNFAEN